jgi:hypothetical protein
MSNLLLISVLGYSLLRKVKVAVVEAAEHKEAHELLTSSMPKEDVCEWTELVEAWESDINNVNPFTRKVTCEKYYYLVCSILTDDEIALTQAAVRGKLADEERAEAARGDAVVVNDDISPSVFVNSGLELEESQCVVSHTLLDCNAEELGSSGDD